MKSAYSDGKVFVDTEEMEVHGKWVTCITRIKCRRGERGKGHASRYMREVILPLADEEGVTLVLAAEAYNEEQALADDEKPLPQEELVAWYERLGFVTDHEGTMWRLPHANVAGSKDPESPGGSARSRDWPVSGVRRWHPDRYRSHRSS